MVTDASALHLRRVTSVHNDVSYSAKRISLKSVPQPIKNYLEILSRTDDTPTLKCPFSINLSQHVIFFIYFIFRKHGQNSSGWSEMILRFETLLYQDTLEETMKEICYAVS